MKYSQSRSESTSALKTLVRMNLSRAGQSLLFHREAEQSSPNTSSCSSSKSSGSIVESMMSAIAIGSSHGWL